MSRRRIVLPLLLAALLVPAIAASAQPPASGDVLVVAGYDLTGTATWLRRIDVTGSAVERLDEVTNDRADLVAFFNPSASPDGTLVAYVGVMEDASGQLFLLDVAAGVSTAIFDDPTTSYSAPAFSPDGARLAFAAAPDGETETDIYVAAPDGSDLVRLTDTPDISELAPVWSPDGTTLAYTVQQEPDVAIYTLPAAGGEPTLIDTAQTPRVSLTWGPDGERLFFVSLTENELGSAIFSISAQGGGVETVYDPEATSDEAPGLDWLAVSPDGARLAFISTTYRFSPSGTVERADSLNLQTLETGEIQSIPLDWGTTLITGLDWIDAVAPLDAE